MSGLTFAQAWVLAGLVPLVLLALLWCWTSRRAGERARLISRAVGQRGMPLATVLMFAATAVAIVAAAGPRWGEEQPPGERVSADVVFVIDVSRSMAAEDVSPDRLSVATDAVNSTISRMAGDRVGVVVFGGSARVRFPLTTDLDSAAEVVASLRPGSVLVDEGTRASAGLDVAADLLREGNGGVAVLITDGDDLGGDPRAAASLFTADGYHLLALGLGTTSGSTVPVLDRFSGELVPKTDASGEPIISRVDESTLTAISQAGQGRYLGTNPGVLPGAVQSAATESARQQAVDAATPVPVERFQWFAGAALVLLFLAFVADVVPWRRAGMVAPVAIMMLVLGGCATRAHELDQQARDSYAVGDYDGAIGLFLEARAENPGDQRIGLNLASAFHRAERYEEAVTASRRVLIEGDDDERQQASASLGRHWFALGDLEAARDSFKQALLLDPRDDAARHDYEVVLQLLAEEAEEPAAGDPEQPDEPGDQPGDEPGDGEPGEEPPGEAEPGQQPGDEPMPGAGEEEPGEGGALTEDDIDRELEELDGQIAALREEAGEEVTTAEALEILDLVAERNEIAALRDGLHGGTAPDDY